MSERTIRGGCLCGQVRYAAKGAPAFAGQCYCRDCQRASGSAFIPFMGWPADQVSFSGETRTFACRSIRGTDAVRNFCPTCGSLVFGGIVGVDAEHTIYAGTLDEPSAFEPLIAIFARDCPPWAVIPPDLATFETMPD